MKEARTANSTYPKGGVSCSKDSFVVKQTLVFQIKFCGKSPALRVAAKRYGQVYETTKRTADKRTTVIELRHSDKVSFDLKQIEVKTSHHFKHGAQPKSQTSRKF